MSKHKVNFFRYALVEFPKPNNPHILVTAWVENIKKFSIHMNDSVVVGHSNGRDSNGGMTTVRVIRRTNTLPKDIHGFITHTANQFPVSEAAVQPELPVVPEGIRLELTFPQDRIDDAKSYLKDALEQLEKI